jgi:acyl-CoA synthetase (AMP-forming)/AMP-acid ligase II
VSQPDAAQRLFDISLVGSARAPALDIDIPDGTVRTLTFGELNERASRMAHALSACGVARGDRVAVHLPNRVEFVELFLACLRLGALFMPVNIIQDTRNCAHRLDADPVSSSRPGRW